MEKDFIAWSGVKKNIDNHHKPPLFREREIWWCSIGMNIGYEIFGKGGKYTRPVLVLKKYSAYSFLGIPMTTKPKQTSPFIYQINCKDKQSLLLFAQVRMFDSRRLYGLIEKIGRDSFDDIKHNFIKTLA